MNTSQSIPTAPASNCDQTQPVAPLVRPYLLILFCVPIFRDLAGREWIDILWARDLIRHTNYIKNLTFAVCVIDSTPPANAVALDEIPELRAVRYVRLPGVQGLKQALLASPRIFLSLWREVGKASIIQAGLAAWPIPEAWYIAPMLWVRRRILYINVESAFWRLTPGQAASFKAKLYSRFRERLNRYCVEHSNISTFTHAGYLRSLLRKDKWRGHVVEASWVDEDAVLPDATVAEDAGRRSTGDTLRLAFAGRLTSEKGILLLIDAVQLCVDRDIRVEVDIFGEGPLTGRLRGIIDNSSLSGKIRLRGTLPYGKAFFSALREFDAIVVPSLSDEQPRIIFDAFSQGLPVIASRTDGHTQCIESGVTGLLFEVGDAQSLFQKIREIILDRRQLAAMSVACLARARSTTHRRMHEIRWRLLATKFPALTER